MMKGLLFCACILAQDFGRGDARIPAAGVHFGSVTQVRSAQDALASLVFFVIFTQGAIHSTLATVRLSRF